MSGLVKATLASGLILVLTSATALPAERPFNLGKIATDEEVAGWDIDAVSYTHLTLPTNINV